MFSQVRVSLVLSFIFLGSLSAVLAQMEFDLCENGLPPPLSINVANCTEKTCVILSSDPVPISISFVLERPVKAMPLLMECWYTRWVNVSLSEDMCLNLDPPTCPSEGEIVTYNVKHQYTRVFGNVITELTAYDENSVGLACARYTMWIGTSP